MKKWKKIALSGAGLAAAGLLCIGIASAGSGEPLWEQAQFTMGIPLENKPSEQWPNENLNGKADAEEPANPDEKTESGETSRLIHPEKNVSAISVEAELGDIVIQKGDKLNVEVVFDSEETENLYKITQRERNDTWTIRIQKIRKMMPSSGSIYTIVTVPEDLQKLNAEADVGTINAYSLKVNNAKIDCDVGDLNLADCTFEVLEADLDVGSMEITDTQIQKANLDLDCGNLQLYGSKIKNLQAVLDLGEAILNLPGSQTDYALKLETDLGQITINGSSYGNQYHPQQNSEDQNIDISASLGGIELSFDH